MYLTEFGVLRIREALDAGTQLRARWLPQAFQLALRAPQVRQMTLFGLFRDPGEKWDVGHDRQAPGAQDAAFGSLQRWSSSRAQSGLVSTALGRLPST